MEQPIRRAVEQQAEVMRYAQTVEPLLRKGSALELDAQRPVPELADAVEQLVTGVA